MKITKETLKDMIAEEMEAALHEKATPGTRRPGRLKRDPLSQAVGDAVKTVAAAPGKGAKAVLDYAADKLPLPKAVGRPRADDSAMQRLSKNVLATAGDAMNTLGITDEDEEKDFQRARELERATDAGKAITPKQKAAATAARDLPRRSMAQKSQDPALRARRRAVERDRAQYRGRGSAMGDQDPAYLRGMRDLRDRDQTEPEPQQSRMRESFNQKGKTKMKLTKDSLKGLIKEELDVMTSEGSPSRVARRASERAAPRKPPFEDAGTGMDTEYARGADDVFSRELDRAMADLAKKYAPKGDEMVGTVTQAYADGFEDGHVFGRDASNELHELPIEKKMYEAGFANAKRIKDAPMMPQMQADVEEKIWDYTSADAEFAPGPYKSKKQAAAAAASRGYAGKKKAKADLTQQRTGRGMPLKESKQRKNLEVVKEMIRSEIKKLR